MVDIVWRVFSILCSCCLVPRISSDLEALFRSLPGYLDAQLLFHENGRSKVGPGCILLCRVSCSYCSIWMQSQHCAAEMTV
jgi:hypothetical protein